MEKQQQMTHFRDHTKYLMNGNRLALFADLKDDVLTYFQLGCSRKDSFNKKLAKAVYDEYQQNKEFPVLYNGKKYHPVVFQVKVENGAFPKKTFIEFNRYNYFRRRERAQKYEVVYLVDRDDKRVSRNFVAKPIFKMDKY